ncbi:M15 family metallopeptidase [Paenibacillus sp. 22594]|uniref:M15 family metallopeptidase n=1 Tax=Paenibacillus sp. 22594 TaxID=3453947 RepID=UPI003F853CFE
MLTLEQVKAKSASKLSGLLSADRAATEALIEFAYAHGVPIVITQGLRSIPEQDGLYAQGRTKPGQIVTNARGGYSYHNFGVAIDFALLLPNGGVSWDTKRDGDGDGVADWDEVVADAKRIGWEWGGDWTSFKDMPHLQITYGLSTADYRTGKRPTQAQLDAVITKINKSKGEDEMRKDVPVKVLLNGKKLTDGLLDDGTTYIPVRALAGVLGATVAYDAATKTVNITK